MPKGQQIKQTIDYFVFCPVSNTTRTFQHKRDMNLYTKRHAKVCNCFERQVESYATAGRGIEATKICFKDQL